MDWSHFGMDRPAFRPAVEPAAYHPAPSHEAALAALVAAFARREPVVLIDGAPGDVGRVVGAVIQHLDFELVQRVVDLAAGLDDPLGDRSLPQCQQGLEERAVDRRDRRIDQ